MQAINQSGAGPCSSIVQHTTTAGMPGPPGDLRVVAMTMTSLTLAWDAAAEHGRSVERYVLEYMPQGGSCWVLAMADLQVSCEITGLSPGQMYMFRVRADNAVRVCFMCKSACALLIVWCSDELTGVRNRATRMRMLRDCLLQALARAIAAAA